MEIFSSDWEGEKAFKTFEPKSNAFIAPVRAAPSVRYSNEKHASRFSVLLEIFKAIKANKNRCGGEECLLCFPMFVAERSSKVKMVPKSQAPSI